MQKKRVIIVGAAGFVGIELVKQIESDNNGQIDLFAITRENGSFILDGRDITLLTEAEIEGQAPFDIVVNLAYPTVLQLQLYPAVNQRILQTIKKLVSPHTKIIQVSTQAVFGFGMDIPVKAEFLPERRDYAYIEAKLSMELLIKKAFPGNALSIIRLGNVWGPGSGSWTAALAEKLLFGKFVNVAGEQGFANITEVKNVASYIKFLIDNPEKINGYNIYHLAEFSYVKWPDLVERMAAELNVTPVNCDINPAYSTSVSTDVFTVIKPSSVGDTYRKLVYGRFSGSYLRSLIRTLGANRFNKIKKTETKHLPSRVKNLTNDDAIFLTVVTSKVEFKAVVDKDWTPKVTLEQSWNNIKEWLSFAGYTK